LWSVYHAQGQTATETAPSHDIVVVGASAGGVRALSELVGGLPADYQGSVFVALHVPPHLPSALAEILARSGPLPAAAARQDEPIQPGRIYVAQPNHHLVVRPGRVSLEFGPRENSARPSVDMLFRSASRAYGPRVVGIVLTGALGDGALGLAVVKLRGGITMVQDPEEAAFTGMPQTALRTARVDYCLRVADMPARLVELSNHVISREPMSNIESEPSEPTAHAADEPDAASPKHANAASGLTCPECHGSLWELTNGHDRRFECRVGHAYSVEALLAEQGEAVEAALWSAINGLQERAATFRRLASGGANGRIFRDRADITERQAGVLHDLLRTLIENATVG
jgi:two-component system, chemotaxis family, protein-glutamate methylesterase/glutaminase